MSQCQAKTKSGSQCKRQALEDSEYCAAHQLVEDAGEGEGQDHTSTGAEDAEGAKDRDTAGDLALIAVGLGVTVATFLVLKTLGRWLPRI